MAQIGLPYRIMYLSRNRSGLRDVVAYVFKPDQSIAGYFPMEECPPPFQGCYFYDYISSISDIEGDYFSKVISPTENNADIVRFELFKDQSGQTATNQRQPTNLFGLVDNHTINGFVNPTEDTYLMVSHDTLLATIEKSEIIVALTGEVDVSASSFGSNIILNLERE